MCICQIAVGHLQEVCGSAYHGAIGRVRKAVHEVLGAVVVGVGVIGKTNTSVLALPRKMHLG